MAADLASAKGVDPILVLLQALRVNTIVNECWRLSGGQGRSGSHVPAPSTICWAARVVGIEDLVRFSLLDS